MIKKLQTCEMKEIAPLFAGWQETMIWSCLQGHMGYALSCGGNPPEAAMLVVADFCFPAGRPDEELIKQLIRCQGTLIIVPENENWSRIIEEVLENHILRISRYAIQKEPEVFDRKKLQDFRDSLSEGYELMPINEVIYGEVMSLDWSRDLCGQFCDYEDYRNRGVGFVVLKDKVPVSGASSYTIYDDGIEIEIDTREDCRGMGLATVCGSALILECLERGIYPSWDAHDLRSVALAEKLGYHRASEYAAYIFENPIKDK